MRKQVELFKGAWNEFGEDKAQRLAASLAYYTIFSITPLLVIAVAIAGLVFGQSQAQAQILAQLKSVFGDAGSKAIQEMLEAARKPKESKLAIVIGVVTLFFGASGVFGQLKDAMNTIWSVRKKDEGGILKMVKDRFLSFAMVLGVGFLLLVSLVVDTAIAAMGKFASSRMPGGEVLWQIVQTAVLYAVVAVMFAMIFRFLPDVRIEWHDVWFGAAFTALLFVIGKIALGFWLGRGTIGSAYGAAGSLVVLLLWVYWSANILFFGAEFTEVYARTHGSRAGEQRAASGEQAPAPPPTQAIPLTARRTPHAAAPPAQPIPLAARRSPRAGRVGGMVAGLFLGALLGGLSALVVVFKSLRKLFT